MTTIKDIAKKAGLHVTTVSGILNGTKGNSRASADTEKKVREIAEELGYVPNQVARQLRYGRTHTIGMVAGDIRNPFFAELAAELEDCLHGQGYELLLSCRGATDEDPLADFPGKSIDGLLVWNERSLLRASPSFFRSCAMVYLGSGPETANRVEIDIEQGMSMALTHLEKSACRRPAFFAPRSSATRGLPQPRAELFTTLTRQLPFENGEPLLVDSTDWCLDTAAAAARDLQRSGNLTADGILAFNDVFAAAWLMAARETGCAVPLVAFDGTSWVRNWRPLIPHVQIPVREIAGAATELLLHRIGNPEAPSEHRTVHPLLKTGVIS